MTVLSKRLSYSNGDLTSYQIGINNGQVYSTTLPNGTSQYATYVGYFSDDMDIGDASINLLEDNYAAVVVLSPQVHANSILSFDLNISCKHFTTSGTPPVTLDPNVTGLIKGFFQYENEYSYNNYINSNLADDVIIDDITNIQTQKTYSLTGVVDLNFTPGWNIQGSLAVIISPTGVSGIKQIAFNYVDILYNAIPPFAPSIIQASGGDASVYLEWNPPNDNGGDDINDYVIQYSNIQNGFDFWQNSINTSSSASNFTITNLINDNPYVFRVAAINDAGTGVFSSSSATIYPEEPKLVTALNFNEDNYTRIRLRRDTSENWFEANPVLALGEAGYETDTRLLKVGDNSTEWNDLGYVKVENSSIDFPEPDDTYLYISDSATNQGASRIIANLSNEDKLNIVGTGGIDVAYNNSYKSLIFSLNDTFSPFSSGSLASPLAEGRPGEVYHDVNYIYICVANNFWRRIDIQPERWFAPEQISVSSNQGSYPSQTFITTSGEYINISGDGDPFPAKASDNLANDGIIFRSSFFNNYSIQDQQYNFSFRYRGGSNTLSAELATQRFNGIFANGVLFSSPDAREEPLGIYTAPDGFHFNRTFFSAYFKVDDCGGYVDFDRKYVYYDGKFLKLCWDSNVYNSNTYYSSTNYNGDYYRHTDGHSKILGFCFDGYPVYGPYGYTDSEIPSNGVSLMTSSYISKQNDDHRPNDWKYTNSLTVENTNYILNSGAFIEDFEYGEGAGVLDQYNGRYAITPEYPDGTYAYYLTFTSDSLLIPKYPYIIGTYSKQQKLT